jgi:hypothetical protein
MTSGGYESHDRGLQTANSAAAARRLGGLSPVAPSAAGNLKARPGQARSVLTAVGARRVRSRAARSGQGRRPKSGHESDARVRRLKCPAHGARVNIQT